jgi:hypothetical protein
MEESTKKPNRQEKQPAQAKMLVRSCCARTLSVRIPNSLLHRFSFTRTDTEIVVQFQADKNEFVSFSRGRDYRDDVQVELGLVERSQCSETGEVKS